MNLKPRMEPLELRQLNCLKNRIDLTSTEENHHWNLFKGYQGEQTFDTWLENLPGDWIILNDLLLETNNTVFQIDTLLLSSEMIYLFEVKNYEGDFFIEGDRWYSISRAEIKNPLLQLKRSESLLRRLIKELGHSHSMEPYLIFVNTEFHLYQSPLNLPIIIFPSQIRRFIKKLNNKSSKLKNPHAKLANKLLSLHLHESPYNRLPKYSFEQLKKGIACLQCASLNTRYITRKIECKDCGFGEDVEASVLRSVKEYRELFPTLKVTTNSVYEWCRVIGSKKVIQKILTKNFEILGHGKASHYVDK